MIEVYDYGKGEYLPDYKQKLYLEISRTTRGNGTHQLCYDSRGIFGSEMRLIGEINYVTDKALDFYGFNGSSSGYYSGYEDEDSPDYRSRAYYRLERSMLRIVADVHGPLSVSELRWFAGLGLFDIGISSVDVDELNEGKDESDKLPSIDSVPGLYEQYLQQGFIDRLQKDGGFVSLLRLGVVADSRDKESFPSTGLWAEAFIQAAPGFANDFSYSQFCATFRHYLPLSGQKAVFAYRLSYTTKLWGEIPFFMLPFYFNTTETRDGYGGARTVRGVLRDRIVADAVFFANLEFRWKYLTTRIFRQDLYCALGAFFDTGCITSQYGKAEGTKSSGRLHSSAGAGLYFALNDNFILTVDCGKALSTEDGVFGLYVHLNWLF